MTVPTDFNDMVDVLGTEEAYRRINAIVDVGQQQMQSSGAYVPDSAAQPPTPAGNDDVIIPATDFTIERVMRDFVVLHGKGGGIFDDRRCEFMSKTDFYTSVGDEVAKKFINSPGRRCVFRRNVVFDPTTTVKKPGYINLFRGLPLTPKQGKCELLLETLFHLCEKDDAVYDWVLKWMAYPLQNPGAKMTTAVVIHGREGAGKNLFWTALQRIYGEYTSIITQNDLEGSFNGWASKKLFVIGNEVVSRQEMFHKKGVMKNMISEPEWTINEKNINQRQEANHANFVFFSNFLQPVTPDKEDRRYLILWTPPKREKAFYKSVAHERDHGGTEALYHYLLNYDLGEFDEYTEPVMTIAKQDLIHLSMKSDERFIELWLNEDMPLTLCPVLTQHLYAAYQFWCKHDGEKFAVSLTEFGTLISKHEFVTKKTDQWYSKGTGRTRGAFALPCGCKKPDDQSKEAWLGNSTAGFMAQLNEWREEASR